MEDRFYDEYVKALKKENVGTFNKGQKAVGWAFIIALLASIVGFVYHKAVNQNEIAIWCVATYLGIAVLASIIVACFDEKRRSKLYTNSLSERISCMKTVIDMFLCSEKYYEKMDFLSDLYEKSLEKRIEREKMYRKAFWAFLTVIGVLVTNMVNASDETIVQAILLFAIIVLVMFALSVAPFFLFMALDTKKKIYEYMIVEIQSVKLMMMGQEQSQDKANKEELINCMNEVKKSLQKYSAQKKK